MNQARIACVGMLAAVVALAVPGRRPTDAAGPAAAGPPASGAAAPKVDPAAPKDEAAVHAGVVVPFLQQHCVRCHGGKKASGEVRLDDLTADMDRHADRWQSVAEVLRDGSMPPKKEPRPEAATVRAVEAWIASAGQRRTPRLPNQGNLVPHELLFGKAAEAAGDAPPGRVWRLSPDGYLGLVRELTRGRPRGVVQPFTLIPERGIRDFAGLYAIDEASTEILVRNAEAIVEAQTAHDIRDGQIKGRNDSVGEFVKLMDPALTPDRARLASAVQTQFRMAIGRQADADEEQRFLALYEKCAAAGDRPGAVKTMLQAVLLRTDALFRSELGTGAGDGRGRRMLAPMELARALSLALGDRREPTLVQAALKGGLTSRQQVADHVRRLLDDPKAEKPQVLRFFHEFFEYHRAGDVFKDKPKDIFHAPTTLISDTDRLVQRVLAADKDVLSELLTTPVTFANYGLKKNKQTRQDDPVPAVVLNRNNDKAQNVEAAYGFADWPNPQPAVPPDGVRLGILMQPSWLAAFSTNFDNDPVRRGRWVRERLLGGTVPDLPIGVAAQVPDDPHRTFRDRLTVTREVRCWKCHQHMDELGLPFENFDHYGRFRTAEKVRDLEATVRNVDKKGKPLGPVLRDAPLVTTGMISGTGDPKLDGPVEDPRALVRRLAASPRVRQVFVRHVFRCFLGRNETLSDARALQEADRAYAESGGSFKALLVSLLTSDPFLYRSTQPAEAAPAGARTEGDRR